MAFYLNYEISFMSPFYSHTYSTFSLLKGTSFKKLYATFDLNISFYLLSVNICRLLENSFISTQILFL